MTKPSILKFIFLALALGPILAGNSTASSQETQPKPKKLAVCSTTQIADFTHQIVQDDWEVHSVLGPGQDPHTYEVGNDDLLMVKRADLCLHNGWNLEGHDWMRVLTRSAGKPLVTCTDHVAPLLTEESDKGPVNDPHAWFDTHRAAIYVQNIAEAIKVADPDRADTFQARTDEYKLRLRELDCWIREQVNAIPLKRRVLMTHHDAFGYFCLAYGFKSVNPVGWTTGELVDVTIEQRQSIIRQIRNLGIKSVFIESTINRDLVEGIATEAGIKIGGELYSDAMGGPGSSAETYLGMMRHNVETIVNHLK